jgi:hypothetical protein
MLMDAPVTSRRGRRWCGVTPLLQLVDDIETFVSALHRYDSFVVVPRHTILTHLSNHCVFSCHAGQPNRFSLLVFVTFVTRYKDVRVSRCHVVSKTTALQLWCAVVGCRGSNARRVCVMHVAQRTRTACATLHVSRF